MWEENTLTFRLLFLHTDCKPEDHGGMKTSAMCPEHTREKKAQLY